MHQTTSSFADFQTFVLDAQEIGVGILTIEPRLDSPRMQVVAFMSHAMPFHRGAVFRRVGGRIEFRY